VLLNGALINLKPGSQLINGYAVDIALDQFLHLGLPKAPEEAFRDPEDILRLGCGPFPGGCRDVNPGHVPESIDPLLDRLV
jgi:hypothetical protein